MKSEQEQCIVCGRYTYTRHHLIFGNGRRAECDADFRNGAPIVVPLCDNCHTLGTRRLHDNPVAENLSKMLGQALWENWYLTDFGDAEKTANIARQAFINRYGKGWL